MKFKPKHAIAALAIAMAGQASAQVIHDLPTGGNSSLYFVALDDLKGRSYFSEMVSNAGSTTVGILHMDDLINNPTGSWTVSLSGLNGFVTAAGSSALADIYAGFGAADTSISLGGGASVPTGSRRLLTSNSTDSVAPEFFNGALTSGTSLGSNYTAFAGQVTGECASSPCLATSSSALAYAGVGNLRGIGTTWGVDGGVSNGDSLAGQIAWDIFLAVSNSTTTTDLSTVTQLALHAVLDLASNVLTISGPAAVIPVPAAVWLLGSAMLGFVGIGRRKKGQPVDGAIAA
jgi:hypothetical protein